MISFGLHHTARIVDAYLVWAQQHGLIISDPETIKAYNKFVLCDRKGRSGPAALAGRLRGRNQVS